MIHHPGRKETMGASNANSAIEIGRPGRKHGELLGSGFGHVFAIGRDMLKISIKDGWSKRLLVLDGKIIAPWTDELTKVACEI
jgi:hypothetical protein